jgi:hypothetical protein
LIKQKYEDLIAGANTVGEKAALMGEQIKETLAEVEKQTAGYDFG